MQNGRAMTEVIAPPVAVAQALIPRADIGETNVTRESAPELDISYTTRAFVALPPLSPMDEAELGLHRLYAFLADYTERYREAPWIEVESC